ncbi:MAG: DUF1211 domain-containing protein [Betaproteobacteria bacterium]|nr:DUF1211 domain-containing protein [Betaproteobacteria bacterium]
MTKGRLEAFCDGVMAVIITIMVLEMKVPHGASLEAIAPVLPVFLTYILSFVFVGIYWSNHHHMFHAVHHVDGAVLWANLHLLFWLSLVPFVTGWMGENHFQPLPVLAYGVVLLGAALAYDLVVRSLLRVHDRDSVIARAYRRDVKGNASVAIYVGSVLVAWFVPWLACLGYVAVALIWIVPDRRFERLLKENAEATHV